MEKKTSFFRRFMRVVLSKTFAFALLALLQIGLLVFLVWQFAQAGVAAYIVLTVVTVLAIIVMLSRDEVNPAYKLMWVVIMMMMPLFGTFFYLIWGHRTVPPKKRRLLAEIERCAAAALPQDEAVMAALGAQDGRLLQSALYLKNHAASPVYPVEGAEYYAVGEDFFPPFLQAVREAKKSVFMEYYIYEEGVMLDATLELLRRKAAEGVDVRVMWDGFGSLFTLPPDFGARLESWGIRWRAFSPLELTIHVSSYAMLNHRDHRKIAVIDGETAFSGGLNFADEYINAKERFGQWKDTAFMVKGRAARALEVTFLRNWDFACGAVDDLAACLPGRAPPAAASADAPPTLEQGFVQPYCDSPLDGENVSENAYLNVIRHAARYVYISTPYLILDHEMTTTLTLAAKSGVDVRILTPGIPDKPRVFMVTQSYYPALLRGGVRIFEYTPGFNHAKMYVSDDRVAIIGSANMDFRSLYLHFENCASFYGGRVVKDARDDMLASFARAREVTLEDTQKTPPLRRFAQMVAKFLAPML